MLRDDVRKLFLELNTWHSKKINILKTLHQKDTHSRYLLKTGNMDGMLDMVIESQSMLDEIDGIDFEIAQASRHVSEITGMDHAGLERFIQESSEPEAAECRTLRGEYLARLREILEDRNELFSEMEKAASSILKDAEELKTIRELRFRKDEDISS